MAGCSHTSIIKQLTGVAAGFPKPEGRVPLGAAGPRGCGHPTQAQRENDFSCKTAESLRFTAGPRELPLLSFPAQAPGLWAHVEAAWDKARASCVLPVLGITSVGLVPRHSRFLPLGPVCNGEVGRKGGTGRKEERVQVDSSRGSGKKQAFPGAQAPRCGGRGQQECCLWPRHPPSFRPPPPHALQPQLASGAPGWLSLRSTCQTEPARCPAEVTPRLRAPCRTLSSSLTLLDSARGHPGQCGIWKGSFTRPLSLQRGDSHTAEADSCFGAKSIKMRNRQRKTSVWGTGCTPHSLLEI